MIPVLILATTYREAQRIAKWHNLQGGQWEYLVSDLRLIGLDRPKVLAAACWPLLWGATRAAHLRDVLITRHADVQEVSCTRHTKAELDAMLAEELSA